MSMRHGKIRTRPTRYTLHLERFFFVVVELIYLMSQIHWNLWVRRLARQQRGSYELRGNTFSCRWRNMFYKDKYRDHKLNSLVWINLVVITAKSLTPLFRPAASCDSWTGNQVRDVQLSCLKGWTTFSFTPLTVLYKASSSRVKYVLTKNVRYVRKISQ